MIYLFYALTFVVSFCSISYQFLLSRAFSQLSQDEILSQSLTLGVYLLSMGIGAFVSRKIVPAKSARSLFQVEALLSVFGSISVIGIYIITTLILLFFPLESIKNFSYQQLAYVMIVGLQVFTIAIGFLTGFEVPLIYNLVKDRLQLEKMNTLLGISYLGALVGSFFVPLVLISNFDVIQSTLVIAFLNIICLGPLLFLAFTKPLQRLSAAGIFMLVIFLNIGVTRSSQWVQQAFMKASYLDLRILEFNLNSLKQTFRLLSQLENIERFQTPYQIIDIVPSEMLPKSSSLSAEFRQDFSMYLNMQPQFSAETFEFYHQSMVHGAFNLAGKIPSEVLILGGGDGLLAAELAKIPEVKKITLVELDPMMIRLANHHPVISALNNKALMQSKVEVQIDDGFQFVRRSKLKYDAVFIDFPFPTSYELGRLFTQEFYSNVKNVLSPNGFFIADIPIAKTSAEGAMMKHPYPHEIVVSTINKAGFKNYFVFGPMDGFIFVTKENRPLAFDYSKFPDSIGFKTLLNLNQTSLEDAEIKDEYVNSIFRPKRFKWR